MTAATRAACVFAHPDDDTYGLGGSLALHAGDVLEVTAIPASALDRLNAGLRERRLEPIDSTQPFMPRAVPDGRIAIAVDCSAVYERKLEALRCHRTQAEMEDVPFDLWPDLLGTEAFVVAWPERSTGDPVGTDLLTLPPAS